MADTKNTEVLPASEPPASVTTAAPVTVVREKGSWVTPLIAALVVVVTLVVGGVGGFALARATGPGGDRPAMQQGQFPGGPGGGQQGGIHQGPGGQQVGPQQGPGGQHGGQQGQPPRPDGDNSDDSADDSTEDSDESGDDTEN